MTEADILLALRDCYDPEIPCNIVDLGLIASISVQPDREAPGAEIPGVPQKHLVHLALTPTNTSEDAHTQLKAQIVNRLAGLEAISRTTITLLPEPLWTPHRITPAGRRILGLDGNPHLIQISSKAP